MMASLPSFLRERRVCVQAGGNWGFWPMLLSQVFQAVYTFEPDAECFACLVANTAENGNVVRMQAALGSARALVDLRRDADTTGNQRIEGAGIYPTLRIDDLGLDVCDLIYLDIEGAEAAALEGAIDTIGHCRPVVIFEVRKAFSVNSFNAGMYLERLGYRDIGRIGNDLVMAPC